MSRSPSAVARRRLAVLRKRADYLRSELVRDPAALGPFGQVELVALEWAVGFIEAARIAAREAGKEKLKENAG